MKHIIPGILLIGILFCAASCATAPVDSTNTLRIGCVDDYPPIMFKDPRGQFAGAEAELGRALAKELGMTARFVPMKFAQLSDALLAGKVDILMAGMTITEPRRIRMAFSSPYLVIGQMALVRLHEVKRYPNNVAIQTANARVGIVAGTTGARLAGETFMNATLVTYQNPEDAVYGLRQNQIDIMLYDAPVVWYYTSEYESEVAIVGTLFSQEELAWAFRPGETALLEAANAAIEKWKANGTLDQVLSHWIPFH